MLKLKFYLIISITCFAQHLIAQSIVTFEQCVDIALANNLTIKNQLIADNILQNSLEAAKYKRLPTAQTFVSGAANWGKGVDPYTNTYANRQFNNYNGGASFNWVLFNGFYNINNIKLQKNDLESNKSQIQKLKNDIIIDLASKYTNILYYQELVQSIENQLKISIQNIDIIQKKINAGTIAKNEIYKSQAQKDLEESNLIQAKNMYEMNLLDLKQLLNIPWNSSIAIAPWSDSIVHLDTTSMLKSNLIHQALATYPTIVLAQNTIEKNQINKKIATSNSYPTLTLGANIGSTYSTFNKYFDLKTQIDNNLSYATNLNLSFPLFNQFQNKTKVKDAQYNFEKSNVSLSIETQKVEKLMLQTYQNYIMSFKKWQASQSAFISSEKSYQSDILKFEYGKINIQEVNISKTNYFQAQANLIKDKYERIFNSFLISFYQK